MKPFFGLFKPRVERLRRKRDTTGLIRLLHLPSDEGKEAANALLSFGPDVLSPLLPEVDSCDDYRRIRVSYVFAELSPNHPEALRKEAFQVLIDLLQDSDGAVRYNAAMALSNLADERSLRPLLLRLDDDDSDVRIKASYGLTQILKKHPEMPHGSELIGPFIEHLRDNSEIVRQNAAFGLDQIFSRLRDSCGAEAALAALLPVADDRVDKVRINVAVALGAVALQVPAGDLRTRAVDKLIAAVTDSDGVVRQLACQSLGLIGDPRGLQALMIALRDPNKWVRAKAATALGKIADRQAEPALRASADDPDPDVRAAVGEVLTQWAIGQSPVPAPTVISPAVPQPPVKPPKKTVDWLSEPAFEWKNGVFAGPESERVAAENRNAISWFVAQGFPPIPSFGGEAMAAEYCFDMAAQAQQIGNHQEAWAGFHQALRRYLQLDNHKQIALTCFNLGKSYGARENWALAQVMFRQSGCLAGRLGDAKGQAWSAFYLGDTCDRLGDRTACRRYWKKAADLFQTISPQDAQMVRQALAKLS
jgi:HEAT repeat protein